MKVLCIDGGGIRGVFALRILQEMEKELGKPIREAFDVIAGTSTGSIIAAAIVRNIPMADVLRDYQLYGEKIFRPQAKVGMFRTIYSDRYLRYFIQNAFGDVTLEEIDKPLLIPAVDLTHGNPYIHHSNFSNAAAETDLSLKLWDAVLSSCSAPVYFPPNNVNGKFLSIDGGLWANNPSLVCVTEIMKHFQCQLEDIKILSIGTGKQEIDFESNDEGWGIRKWLPFNLQRMKVKPKILDLALHLSSESVSYHCQELLGSNYLRVNESLGKEIPFDDVEYVKHLIQLGTECIEKNRENIVQFLEKE